MAKSSAALAKQEPQAEATGLASALGSALANMDPSSLPTGLGPKQAGDMADAIRKLNSKKELPDGSIASHNLWVDMVTGEAFKAMDVVLVARHRVNSLHTYDEGENKYQVQCFSGDQQEGKMSDGTERPCEGCPEQKWRKVEKDGKTKNVKPCSELQTWVAIDAETLEEFFLPVGGTGVGPFRQHLRVHHLGKLRRYLPTAPPDADLPAFALRVRLGAEMGKGNSFAVPTLEVLGETPADLFGICLERHEEFAKRAKDRALRGGHQDFDASGADDNGASAGNAAAAKPGAMKGGDL